MLGRSGLLRLVGSVATTALLTACAPDVERAAPPLSADVLETRAARSQAKVSVALANEGATPLEVEHVRLRSPLFEELAPTERPMTVPADGSSGRLFLAYGAARCDRDVALDAVLVVGVRDGDRLREVEAPVTDRTPGLGRLHELACAAQEVRAQAYLQLGASWRRTVEDGEAVLRSTLRLTRRGAQEVTVTRVDGNVLFTLETPARDPLLVLAPGQDEATVEVVLRATRCDPHALTESKKEMVFSFPLFARLPGGEEVSVPLSVPERGRPAVLALLHEVCIAPLEAAR